MLDRRVRQGRYPRREVCVDIAHFRQKGAALAERARLDKVVVKRAGKPHVVLIHPAFAERLLGSAASKTPRPRKVAESGSERLRHVRELLGKYVPTGSNIVDEFIAQRRLDAQMESKKYE